MSEKQTFQIPEDVLSACCILFNARMGIARGIVHALQSPDVTIAFEKNVEKYLSHLSLDTEKRNRVRAASMKKLTHARTILHAFTAGGGWPVTAVSSVVPARMGNADTGNDDTNTYYRGKTKRGRLRFGSFLFYKGTVPLESVRRALEWQRSRRPLIGRLAMEKGFLLPSDFAEILFYLPAGHSFGEVAVRRGYLSERQLQQLLNEQRRYSSPVGEYFILQGHLSRSRLERYHREFVRHNRRHECDEEYDAVASA